MIFDMNIENLNARDGILRWNPYDAQFILEKLSGFFLPAFEKTAFYQIRMPLQ